jgi:Protein of unknown function (DUF732)
VIVSTTLRVDMRALAAPAVLVGLVGAATISAAPAQADTTTDIFLGALNNAGIPYTNPASAIALGQAICPMLVQPGGRAATIASSVLGANGISPEMAGLFTSIAISAFCPSVVTSLANGNWVNAVPAVF